jgi:hypothetical protein
LFYQPKRRRKKIQLLKRVLALTVETYNYLVDYRKSTLTANRIYQRRKKYFHNFEKFTPFMVGAKVSSMKYFTVKNLLKLSLLLLLVI